MKFKMCALTQLKSKSFTNTNKRHRTTSRKNYYLYSPFSSKQLMETDNVNTIIEFMRWEENGALRHKKYKTYFFGTPEKPMIQPSDIIYIKGHDMGGYQPEYDSYFCKRYPELTRLALSERPYALREGDNILSVKEIAQRMISDGLIRDLITLKIFTCDTNSVANQRAEELKKALLLYDKDINIKIDFYPDHYLSLGIAGSNKKAIHKDKIKELNLSPEGELLSEESALNVIAVRPSSIRQTISTQNHVSNFIRSM